LALRGRNNEEEEHKMEVLFYISRFDWVYGMEDTKVTSSQLNPILTKVVIDNLSHHQDI
jgi:hypothetical protein